MEIRVSTNHVGEVQMIFCEKQGHDLFLYNPFTGESLTISRSISIPKEFIATFDWSMGNGIFDAMRKCADENGAKQPERSLIEGELTATKVHLEDMRRLVFEPNISGIPSKK